MFIEVDGKESFCFRPMLVEETENKLDWSGNAKGKRITINDKYLTVTLYEQFRRPEEMICKVNVNLNDVCMNANEEKEREFLVEYPNNDGSA